MLRDVNSARMCNRSVRFRTLQVLNYRKLNTKTSLFVPACILLRKSLSFWLVKRQELKKYAEMKKLKAALAVLALVALTGCDFSGGCVQGYGPVTYQTREWDDFTGVSFGDDFEVRVTMADTFGIEVQAQENLHQMIEIYVSGTTLVIQTEGNSCVSSIAPIIVYVSLPVLEEIRNSGSGRISADRAEAAEFDCYNSGSGIISIDSVFAKSVFLGNSASGELYLGASYPDDIQLSQTGSGELDAGFIFTPLEVSINHSASGKVYGTVLDGLEVDAKLSGSGLIGLDGNAESAELSLSASGKIDALNMMLSDANTTVSGSGKIYVYATDFLYVTITGSGDVYYRGNPQITTRVSGSGSVRPY